MPSSVYKHNVVSSPSKAARISNYLLTLLVCLSLLGIITLSLRLSTRSSEQHLETLSLEELKKKAEEEKNSPRVLYFLGKQQEQNGRSRDAMDTYWHSLQLDADNEEGWLAWARTTESVLGQEQSKKVLDLWLQSFPNSAIALLNLARYHERRNEHSLAYETAEKGVALEPKRGEFWQIMGGAAIAMGKFREAESAFRHAADISPREWRNHAGLSDALSRLSRQEEAIASARKAVEHAPQETIPHLLLGTLLLQSARNDSEIEAARIELLEANKTAASLPPSGQFQLALTLGDCYKRQRKWHNALVSYQHAERLRPFDPTVPYSLIRIYRGLADTVNLKKASARYETLNGYNQEIKVLTSRLETSPNDVQARLQLARLYAKCEQIDLAMKNYQNLLEISPEMKVARQEFERLTMRLSNQELHRQ